MLAAGLLAAGAFRFAIRRRHAHNAPKLDSLSSDWLAHERGRGEHT
jgi:hypothetical protein